MAYTSTAELQKRYTEKAVLQLTDRDEDGTPDADVITAAIADADALIDGYIRTRYALPIDPPPAIVALCSQAVSWFYLHHGRAPEHVRQGYDDALATLKDIANGKLDLDVSGIEAPYAADAAGVEGTLDEDDRTFTKETLSGWF